MKERLNSEDYIICDVCGKKVRAIKIETHKKQHEDTPAPSYSCDKCGKKYAHMYTLVVSFLTKFF